MSKRALMLRTCDKDMQSYGGFQWPKSGRVTALDWNDRAECGCGLHGLPWGEGCGGLLNWSESAKWLVCEVDPDLEVPISGKSKWPWADVVFVGDRESATKYLHENGGSGRAIVGSTVSGWDYSTVSGGYRSTVSGGECSTVSGGDYSTVSGGDYSTVSGGDRSTVSGGNGSTVSGGNGSTVSGGDYSTVSGGYRSTVSGGNGSTVSGGNGSTVSGGNNSGLILKRWNGKRYRYSVAEVGESGIKANTPYKLDDKGEFVEVETKEVANA